MHKHLESLLIPNFEQENRFVRITRLEYAAGEKGARVSLGDALTTS